jgi:hypothetical protein
MDLTLISIVVGLGLTELLLTFYHLVRARRRVIWDALPLAWALLILIAVVNYWWGIRAIMAQANGWTSGTFMLTMISPVSIFLACAAALPRIEREGPVDMTTAYADERAAFFVYFLAYQAGNWLIDLAGLTGSLPWIVAAHRAAVCVALIIAMIARSRRWDWAAAGLVATAYAMRLITQLAN